MHFFKTRKTWLAPGKFAAEINDNECAFDQGYVG